MGGFMRGGHRRLLGETHGPEPARLRIGRVDGAYSHQ